MRDLRLLAAPLRRSLAGAVGFAFLAVLPAEGQVRAAPGDWPTYGGDAGGLKYAPLDRINRENVHRLRVAWTWDAGESEISGPASPLKEQSVRPGNFETTPIEMGDTLWLSTPYNRVVALDAGSGEELWAHDPRAWQWGQPPNGTGFVHRGVALWEDDDGSRRIFLNTRWELLALDARTGETVESFGVRGRADVARHAMWPVIPLHFTSTSPPVVYDDLVIVGNGLWDGFVYPRDPPGHIYAFDARTGSLRWRFDLIPQKGQYGHETWEGGSAERTGHTNAWAPMVLDAQRGILYAGIGTPANDYYGGDRLGDNLYAESLVALDARTGQRLWHFQTVHHGLWDFDLPGAPVLYTATVDGRRVDAVAIAGKTGFVYAFDRVTGRPIWPIEERAVLSSDVPGERAAPTQPFPTKPAPFARQGFSEDDLLSLTRELRARAAEVVAGHRMGPLFTPPSQEGTLAMPGIIGGGNWGGAAVDPETGILYVKATEEPSLLKLAPADPQRVVAQWDLDRTARMGLSVDGLPVSDPPWGTLTAIDMNSGEHVWRVAAGDRPDLRDHPALEGVDLPERLGRAGAPGGIVTRGGLVFLTGGGDVLWAHDKTTGEVLWQGQLPERGYANPMTYATSDGRQFVVIATGTGSSPRTLVAFALDDDAGTP
ncbi:MAG: pyrroloquinoline quinone-dependent dehydrogenase [Gemmatimonadota bacterium]|nr:pyrroloquinoline quinone-dependent dehydrogenase [Gemmatimonadota bacterium]